MNLLKFIIFTIIGAGAWNAILAYAGYLLKSNWTEIMKYSNIADIIVIVAIVAVICYYAYSLYKHSRGKGEGNLL